MSSEQSDQNDEWGLVTYITVNGAYREIAGRVSKVQLDGWEVVRVDLPEGPLPVFKVELSPKAVYAIRYLERSTVEGMARRRPYEANAFWHA